MTSILESRNRKKLKEAVVPTPAMKPPGAICFVAVGTTGNRVELALFRLVVSAYRGRLPTNVRFIAIDADRDSRRSDCVLEQTLVPFVQCAKKGAGTVISKGKELAEPHFPKIEREISLAMTSLASSTEEQFGGLAGSCSQTCVAIAGSGGGASGGLNDVVLSAAHLGAANLALEQFEVDIVTIGSEMPHRDVARDPTPDLVDRIRANSAESAKWRYAQMATHHSISVEVPGKKTMRIRGGTRITNNIEFDWTNENLTLKTTEQLIEMMAACLFFRYFTSAGRQRDSRLCDLIVTGITGQNHPLQYQAAK